MRARVRIVVEDGTARGEGLSVQIVASPPEGGDLLPITEPCSAPEALEAQVEAFQQELTDLLWEARALFAKATRPKEPVVQLPETLEGLWELMERSRSLEEMQSIFNGLDEGRRRKLADFIFGHANVFKGAGALFAQHYDEEQGVIG